jgi:lipopolysaccharide/colanic/teichoic acid biosynthesis glycosyltransferase
LASSILYSSTGGRVVTILPEPGIGYDPSIAQGAVPESADFEEDLELPTAEPSRNRTSFAPGSFAALNYSSEALDLYHRWPVLSELPTQTRKYELGKRIFDVVLAIVIFPVIAILIAVIGAMIAFTSGGPVFFRQRRIGQHGREFLIWKFRTMHPRADRILADFIKRNPTAREEWNHAHKLRNDPRITRLGRVLRKTSLDELPQILNVFSGDMSFVGPRPIVRAESAKYAERFPYYLAAVPGITGLWQVSGRCDVSYEARTVLDETYVCKWTLARDIWILLKTPRAVVYRDGAY